MAGQQAQSREGGEQLKLASMGRIQPMTSSDIFQVGLYATSVSELLNGGKRALRLVPCLPWFTASTQPPAFKPRRVDL
jgi:hypothetical protein